MIPTFGLILLAYYALYVVGFFPANLDQVVLMTPLPSGVTWGPTYGHLLLAVGLVGLFIEIFKSTRTTDTTIIEHVLATIVLIAYLDLWLIYPWAGNSYFLLLGLMSLLDVVAGFTVTIASARRDIDLRN